MFCKQFQTFDVDSAMNANFRAPVLLQTEMLKKKKINKNAYQIARDVVKIHDLTGSAVLDFKYDRDGHPVLIEINPLVSLQNI